MAIAENTCSRRFGLICQQVMWCSHGVARLLLGRNIQVRPGISKTKRTFISRLAARPNPETADDVSRIFGFDDVEI